MSKALTTTTFDYSQETPDVRSKAIYLAGVINQEKQSHVKSGMVIGKAIHDAHQLFAGKGSEGRFSAWVEAECGYSRNTAYKYMRVWDKFGKCNAAIHFDVSAMQALAGPNTPGKAIAEAMKLANNGQYVSQAAALALIEKHSEPKPEKEPKAKDPEQKDARSATGDGANNSTDSPNALPTEGTVNQAEHGAQGSGGAPGNEQSQAKKAEYIDPVEAACSHEWEMDDAEGGEFCKHCHVPRPETPDDSEVGKLFTKVLKDIGHIIQAINAINRAKPDPLHSTIYDTIDIAYRDLNKWRKRARSK